MAKVLRRCPKCSQKITNKIECRNCGLLFDRYFKTEAQKKAAERARAAKKAKAQQLINGIVLFLVICIVGGGAFYYFEFRAPSSPAVVKSSQKSEKPQNSTTAQPGNNPKDSAQVSRVKQATISIKAPWASGTGFFVGKDLVVTSKHIIEQNRDHLVEARHTFEQYRNRVAQENDKLQAMKQQYTEMDAGTTKDELGVIISDGEEQLQRALTDQQELEDIMLKAEAGLQDNTIFAVFGDDSKIAVSSISVSENHNLALLTVIGSNTEGAPLPAPGSSIKPGDKVYTVGPKGTFIASTFIDFYRGDSPQDYFIQTDRSFKPNNSGGPLIDAEGFVRGISTNTGFGVEGSGFAIPIETIRSEFNL